MLDLAAPFALDFLDQLAQEAEHRVIPVLALAREGQQEQDAQRLARLRASLAALEVALSLDDVRERITSAMSAARTGQAPTATPRRPPRGRRERLRGRKVLVVDDDPRNVFALSSTLKQYGMSVTEATSGQAGINESSSRPPTPISCSWTS